MTPSIAGILHNQTYCAFLCKFFFYSNATLLQLLFSLSLLFEKEVMEKKKKRKVYKMNLSLSC